MVYNTIEEKIYDTDEEYDLFLKSLSVNEKSLFADLITRAHRTLNIGKNKIWFKITIKEFRMFQEQKMTIEDFKIYQEKLYEKKN